MFYLNNYCFILKINKIFEYFKIKIKIVIQLIIHYFFIFYKSKDLNL
jgi:hypothetical protein